MFDILTAAKPAFGTPPFSTPYGQSGGAQVPTTPETRPYKRGLGGFLDRFFNPTNGLGQFGQALVAASGGPIGDASAYMLKARELESQQRKGPHFEHIGDSFGIIDDNTGQFTPTYTAPHQDDEITRLMKAAGVDPNSPEGQQGYRQAYENRIDPLANVQLGNGSFANVPRSQIGSLPGMSPVGGAPSSAPTEPPPATMSPAGGVPGRLAPRGIRNNNPLNLTMSPFTRSQQGFTGTDSGGRYATFDSPEDGLLAARSLLGSYAKRGFDTPAEIIGRWAPRQENGASTGNYVNSVSGRLGIGPNDTVPANRYGDLVSAMSDFENGRRGTVRVATAPTKIGSKAEYDALPSGAMFIAPDGTRRRKP
jgi:hypothetical protein